MTILELKQALISLGVPEQLYSILRGGLPNEVLCLVQNSEQEWEVYYSERGRKVGVKLFETEALACEYFFNKLSRYAIK